MNFPQTCGILSTNRANSDVSHERLCYTRRISTRNLQTAAFSLIELLVVIAIVAVLAVSSSVALSSVNKSQKVWVVLTDLSSLIEFAKAEAISKNTYVRVGFQNDVTSDGTNRLYVGAVASKDGSKNLSAVNLYPISRLLKFDGIRMSDRSEMGGPVIASLDPGASPVSIASTASNVSFTMPNGGQTVDFSGTSLTFTPQGEVMINNPTSASSPYLSLMELGVQSFNGATVAAESGQGILWVYGSSGLTRIFR